MKALGWILAAIGVCYAIWAFNMDVSVSVSSTYVPGYGSVGGGDVANLDLMARRQNHLIFASVLTVIGVLIGLLAPGENRSNPPLVSPTPATSRRVYEGVRDLTLDAYRLWLAEEYQINRNEVFDRFVMGETTFDTLNEALARAHELENQKRAEAEEVERERLRKQEEYRLYAENAQEQAEADWERNKPKLIAGGFIFAIMAVGGIYFLIDKANKDRAESVALMKVEIAKLHEEYGFDLSEQSVSRIEEIEEYESYRCDDAMNGTLVTFAPETEADDMLPLLDTALGEHDTDYEYEGSGEWAWNKDDTHFILKSVTSDLTLCIAKKA